MHLPRLMPADKRCVVVHTSETVMNSDKLRYIDEQRTHVWLYKHDPDNEPTKKHNGQNGMLFANRMNAPRARNEIGWRSMKCLHANLLYSCVCSVVSIWISAIGFSTRQLFSMLIARKWIQLQLEKFFESIRSWGCSRIFAKTCRRIRGSMVCFLDRNVIGDSHEHE